jgi:hypothetical protein
MAREKLAHKGAVGAHENYCLLSSRLCAPITLILYDLQVQMNYLAHAYLSFHQPQILVGNMISDFVKGKKQFDYPPTVQQGIRLHRNIDTFTDQHPATKKAKEFLKPAVGPYSGAFVDVVYDHFLARDKTHFSETGLQDFAKEVYTQLHANNAIAAGTFCGDVALHVCHRTGCTDIILQAGSKRFWRRSTQGAVPG